MVMGVCGVVFFFFLRVAILKDVKWYLLVIFICIFLMISDVKHFFSCAYWLFVYSSLEKCVFKFFAYIQIQLFLFIYLVSQFVYLFIQLVSQLVMAVSGLSFGTWDLSLQRMGFSLVVAHGLSSCGARAQLPCGMWDLSSLTRDLTRVPCFGRWILKHWTTREVPSCFFVVAFQFFIYSGY